MPANNGAPADFPIPSVELDEFIRGYLVCLLWQSPEDDDGNRLDQSYNISDFAPAALLSSRDDCESFITLAHSDLKSAVKRHGATWGGLGHDFCLTRNHHGAGYWDRGWGSLGDALTTRAQTHGSVDVYEGDNGMLYVQ